MSELTDAERGELVDYFLIGSSGMVLADKVERILTARLAEQREQIARAIEGEVSRELTAGPGVERSAERWAYRRAAHIARGLV